MSRRDKQRLRLDALEQALLRELMAAVAAACDDPRSQLFVAERFNPWPELATRTDTLTDRLVRDAQTVLDLRAELGESGPSAASLFIEYCKRFLDTADHNRPGVRKHALALLRELQAMSA